MSFPYPFRERTAVLPVGAFFSGVLGTPGGARGFSRAMRAEHRGDANFFNLSPAYPGSSNSFDKRKFGVPGGVVKTEAMDTDAFAYGSSPEDANFTAIVEFYADKLKALLQNRSYNMAVNLAKKVLDSNESIEIRRIAKDLLNAQDTEYYELSDSVSGNSAQLNELMSKAGAVTITQRASMLNRVFRDPRVSALNELNRNNTQKVTDALGYDDAAFRFLEQQQQQQQQQQDSVEIEPGVPDTNTQKALEIAEFAEGLNADDLSVQVAAFESITAGARRSVPPIADDWKARRGNVTAPQKLQKRFKDMMIQRKLSLNVFNEQAKRADEKLAELGDLGQYEDFVIAWKDGRYSFSEQVRSKLRSATRQLEALSRLSEVRDEAVDGIERQLEEENGYTLDFVQRLLED